jgi:hypothetical protein
MSLTEYVVPIVLPLRRIASGDFEQAPGTTTMMKRSSGKNGVRDVRDTERSIGE